MSNPKVSILIPVYNVSAFIERCGRSLFEQTFQELEFIFVDDCSSDDSMDKLNLVIQEYPRLRDKIRIIHHNINKGISAARNSAIDNASGDYIAFADSDDYIEPTMIEILYNKAIEKNADIVVSDFFTEYTDKTIYCEDFVEENSPNNFALLIKQEQTYPCFWNKLIKSDLLQRPDCRIPEGLNYGEDFYTMARLYYFAKKITKVNQAFYHYVRYNSNAFTKTRTRMHFENLILFWDLFDLFLKQHNEYKENSTTTELLKVKAKVLLMIDTNSYKLRKEFANIFLEEEKKHFAELKRGERLMSFFIQKRLFLLAHFFQILLVAKNRIQNRL